MAETKTLVPGGHAFILDEDGDILYIDGDNHGGPECAKCGGVWCQHCKPYIFKEKCPNRDLTLPGLDFE